MRSNFYNSAGAIFSEEHTESCVRVGKEWVLGVAHYRKQLRHIITRQLSFDLVDKINGGKAQYSKRNCFSFKCLDADFENVEGFNVVWKWQEHKNLQVGLFRVNKNIQGEYPLESDDILLGGDKNPVKANSPVFVAGFPRDTWTREIVEGRISSVSDMHAYADLSRAVPGFSGGPVFSSDGKLLGVLLNNSDNVGARNVKFTLLSAISAHFKDKGFALNQTPTLI